MKLQQNSLGRLATVGTPEEGEEQRFTCHSVHGTEAPGERALCSSLRTVHARNTACPEQIRFGEKGLSLETRLEEGGDWIREGIRKP